MDEAERARKKRREQNRRYRENNPEKAREQARRWRDANREHRAAYQAAWRDRNRDHVRELNREYMRRKTAEARTDVERKAQKAEYARTRYHADVGASRAKAREYREAARARDPEGYRISRKRANDSWRAKHADEINARLRERNRIDPDAKRARSRRHYEKHAEERRAYRRRYYLGSLPVGNFALRTLRSPSAPSHASVPSITASGPTGPLKGEHSCEQAKLWPHSR